MEFILKQHRTCVQPLVKIRLAMLLKLNLADPGSLAVSTTALLAKGRESCHRRIARF